MTELKEILSKIREIPPLPNIALKVIRTTSKPDVSVRDIIDVVRLDQGLVGKILKLCNSSYFGLRRTVDSLQSALVLLGDTALINTVLNSCSSDFLQKNVTGYDLRRGELWRHSVGCAFASHSLSEKVHTTNKDVVYTAGLLHDIGKIALNAFMTEKFGEIVKRVQESDAEFITIEKELLGYHHGEIGAMIAQNWKFPDVIIDAVRYHHEPEKAEVDKEVTFIVHIGDILSLMLGYGCGVAGLHYQFHRDAIKHFDVSDDMIERISADVVEAVAKADEFLKL